MGRLGAGIFESGGAEGFGAKLWEWANPEQVRREYEAVGKTAPPPVSFDEVLNTAYGQARETAQAAGENLTTGFQLAKTALGIGAVLYAFHLLTKWKGKR